MSWSAKQAEKVSKIAEDASGLTATITIRVRACGTIRAEVNQTPVWPEHPESGVPEAAIA
jgi:hypothetical protein